MPSVVDEDDFVAKLKNRTMMLLGDEAMDVLASKTVAIGGCGGVGGAAAMTLARLGVGAFTLADPGIYDEPDFNRQWAGNRQVLGQNKARVHADALKTINPKVNLRIFTKGVTEDNLDEFLDGADLLVDCLDISVPLSLRTRYYRRAMEREIYCVSAPIFGFGTLIFGARPGGMGMDTLIERFVDVASKESKLPPGFIDFFFPPHLQAIEAHIKTHRVPSCSVSVVIATGQVVAEVALSFLRELYPGCRKPLALPDVMAIEPMTGTSRVVHYEELFNAKERGSLKHERAEALERSHHNVVLLDSDSISIDLLSDSHADRKWPPADPPESTAEGELPIRLGQVFPKKHHCLVFRGRYAEALALRSALEPGRPVVTNGLFPTARLHLSELGIPVLEAVPESSFTLEALSTDRANIDFARLEGALREGAQAAYIELASNAHGGAAVSLGHLQRIRELCEARGAKLLVDTTRTFDNAALLMHRSENDGVSILDLVQRIHSLAHICVGSLTKMMRTPVGGLVATDDAEVASRVRRLSSLMMGDGIRPSDRGLIAAGLRELLSPGWAEARMHTVQRLAERLFAGGAPVLQPFGAHAVYLDAKRAFASTTQHASWRLCRHMYLETGIRMAPNMGTPTQQARDVDLVRIAIPTGVAMDVDAVAEVVLHGLKNLEQSASLRELPNEATLGGLVPHFGLEPA